MLASPSKARGLERCRGEYRKERYICERRALAPEQLAEWTGTEARYVGEWLNANAAACYVAYDSAAGTGTLTAKQAMMFAAEDSVCFMGGRFELAVAMFNDDENGDAFRTGAGAG